MQLLLRQWRSPLSGAILVQKESGGFHCNPLPSVNKSRSQAKAMRFLLERHFSRDTKAASVCKTADHELSPSVLWFFSSSLSPSLLRQAKLEEALALATDFQNSLQDFINWLTLAEQSLNIAPPASLILNAVLAQIDEHKVPNSSP